MKEKVIKDASANVPCISDNPIQEQGELFAHELASWPVKDDMASMEFSLFSLSKKKDTNTKEFRRGNKAVRIIPSSVGAATQFDKDLLIYAGSRLVEAHKQGLAVSRTVHVDSSDFLAHTARSDGGASYDRILDMLRRLRGTTIETNIPTGKDKITQTDGFSMIDSFRVLSQKKASYMKKNTKTGVSEKVETERVFAFTVTLSEWFYNGLMNYEVLTLDKEYFQITSPIHRRLYEIARKHCGDQVLWKINIDLLAEKIGTTQERYRLREDIRTAIKADRLPDYRIALDTSATPDFVVFYTRDTARLSIDLLAKKNYAWFESLERSENAKKSKKQQASEG
jgi:plasmid replication initiation protein